MNSSQLLNLHKYLHDTKIKFVTYDGMRMPISVNRTGVRFLIIEGTKYIQQNPNKDTSWANMAKQGHTITWGIKPGKWDLIVDNEIKVSSND